jgi:purine-binding chemotaxis protein CheW
MLILRINEQVYGTIVDKVDKVVGINHEQIQPPHPIFGDINIKFISGVVEKQGALYIILDVVRIFGQNKEDKEKEAVGVGDSGSYFTPSAASPAERPQEQQRVTDSAIGFIKEGLAVLRRFTASPLNEAWLRKRFSEWSIGRSGNDIQLKGASDADEFLGSFISPCTGTFWDENYAMAVKSILPKLSSNSIQVWNVGCGKGFETYSFMCILKSRYPDGRIKIWANDNDIMAVSQAPNMTFDLDEVPDYCKGYMVKGKTGYSFNQTIKDSIVFEYHDVLHANPLPDLDIILVRDIMSFFPEQDQDRMIADFAERLKKEGLVIVGRNEELPKVGWISVANEPVSAYMRNA